MARSNRQLTQFAVNKLREYLMGGPENFQDETAGNTTVSLEMCPCGDYLNVSLQFKLYGKVILGIGFNPINHRVPIVFGINSGDFYDSKGRPSRTTRERLNGLLDFLGSNGYMPEGTRVFLRDDIGCCLGKGDSCRVLGQDSPVLIMLSHPTDLVFS